MSAKGYLLLDGNNLGYAACSLKKLSVGGQDTQAVFHMLSWLRGLVARYPQLVPIVLWDGRSWRYNVYDEYKGNRDKEVKTKNDELQAAIRKSLLTQKPLIGKALQALGCRQMIALNLEADDLAGMLVQRYAPKGQKIVMISGDKDWVQLVRSNVGWFDPIRNLVITEGTISKKLGYEKITKDRKTGDETSEWRGVPSPAAWLDIKCLMGDTSDNVPGVGGIGDKGAIDMLIQFGSVASFMNRANLEKLPLPKKLADFASDEAKWAIYQRNQVLMDLTSSHIPAPQGLKITNGSLDVNAFSEICADLEFKSFLNDLHGWIEPFVTHASVMKDTA